ncbi:MAG: hypothetical protein QNJ90_07695 [Planctomycetota bacterium]|nr:hypothetical protein [Planctomycetota bacterium]
MLRIGVCTLLLSLAALVLACGGGGGGGDGPNPVTPGGTLRALAIQGQPAPGTAGDFEAFDTYPVMDAADGGWCAFVAQTTDVTKPDVLYVAQPDDVVTVVPVFASGDPVPDLTDGTIGNIDRAWMCPDGTVVAHVGVEGNTLGRSFAVLSARVTGGAAVDKALMVANLDDVSGSGGTGLLQFIQFETALKASDGTLWFLGQDSGTGTTDLWSVEKDGTGLTVHRAVGDALDGGAVVTSIDAFGIDTAGSIFCVVVTANAGPARRMLVKTSVGATLNLEFFRTGDLFPTGPGTVLDPHKGGRLVVFPGGEVAWVAQGNQGGVDDVLMYFDPIPAPVTYVELIRSGDTATDTANGQHAVIDMLSTAPSCEFPQIESTVLGSGSGVTRGTFGVFDTAGNHTLDSSNLVLSGGALVPASTIDLSNTSQPYTEASTDGSFVFAQAFSGTSALFWLVRGSGTTAIAAEGGPAPGGDTFTAFEPTSAHTGADDVVLFRAGLTTAGSGIFRQGP